MTIMEYGEKQQRNQEVHQWTADPASCQRVQGGSTPRNGTEQEKPQRGRQRWRLLPAVTLEGLWGQNQKVRRTEVGSGKVGVR